MKNAILNTSEVKDRLRDALKKSTAVYADIRFESHDSTSIAYRGPETEHVGSCIFYGGVVRACTKDGWGMVTFDSLENLDSHLQKACNNAALAGTGKTQILP
ncbi:MAG: hypothetical protein GX811_06550, partial [Lentisphaerae bacterium]|nr:hypothetical protein [Lentisphaerota bacterium]